ncbi:MAG: hypothetical protein ACO31I_02390 [Prochlorotrichaceae cyanobacterium]|jgi:hypothetical protein
MKTALKTLGITLAAGASSLLVGTQAEAISFTQGSLNVDVLGNKCIKAGKVTQCADLGTVYDSVTGGIIEYGDNLPLALTPGSNTQQPSFDPDNTSDSIKRYNVTRETVAGHRNPARTPIVVSNLLGAFEFFWGSVDSHNVVDFYKAGSKIGSINGTKLANEIFNPDIPANAAGNYKFDAYLNITGDFDKAVLFTQALNSDNVPGNQKSFEVAVAVPEPVSVVSFLVVGLLAGGSCLKRSAEA